MRNWNRTASLLFLAASAVYAGGAIQGVGTTAARAADQANTAASNVRLLSAVPAESLADAGPAAASPAPLSASAPAAAPESVADDAIPAAPTPSPEKGASVTSNQVNVGPAGTVEIHVNDAKLVEVLRMLSMQSQKNIIATKEVSGTVTANLYGVTVPEALNAILSANGYGYVEKGNFIYVYTKKQLEDMQKAAHQMKTEVFRLYYTPAANAQNLIKPVLSTGAQVSLTTPAQSGIASGATDAGGDTHSGGDMLVVTDYPENLERVRGILKQVDQRPQQVLVEATMLAVTLNEDNQLGVNFTILGGVDFSSLANVGSAGTGSGLSQALTGGIATNSAANAVNDRGFVAGQAGGNGLQVGIVKNNVGMFINALESVTNSTVLANPKVLVLNKQRGEVHVGNDIGYRGTTTQTETASTEQVQFLSTGIRLIFRPYIGDDGWIRMEVHPEDSDGSLDKTTLLPSKRTTEVTTNVMVRNGHTIVIGGLFRDSNAINKTQVPILGNLPLVGPLFRSQADSTQRQEIIILLTPHIIKDENAYAEASQKLLDDAEQLRVGVRKGMMPWGRERLAESSYEKAVAEMNKPNPDRKKAIWYLNCATNLNPTFLEAINLKQSLTGHEVSDVDNSAIRDFVRQRILDQNHPAATQPTLGLTPAELPLEAAMGE
jgi:type IV pilus assembly protein PilQ